MKMFIFLSVIGLLVWMTGCSDNETAMRVLKEAGHEDARTKGYAFMGCNEDDFYRTEFTVPAYWGMRNGTVCAPLFGPSRITFH